MNEEPPGTSKNLSDDLKAFENLPDRTRELLLLGEKSEKSTGKGQADVDEKIEAQSDLNKQ